MSEKETISQAEIEKAINAVKAIKDGPRALQLYMDICTKCGTCAEQCHVAQANPDRRTNPALRSDLIRQIYKNGSVSKKLSALLRGNTDVPLTEEEIQACPKTRRKMSSMCRVWYPVEKHAAISSGLITLRRS